MVSRYYPPCKTSVNTLCFYCVILGHPICICIWPRGGGLFLIGTSPAQLWFLLMLFDVFLFYYFISDLLINRPLYIWLLVCSSSYVLSVFIPINIFQIKTACMYVLYFGFGILVRKGHFNYLMNIPVFILFIANITLFYSFNYSSLSLSKHILFFCNPLLS